MSPATLALLALAVLAWRGAPRAAARLGERAVLINGSASDDPGFTGEALQTPQRGRASLVPSLAASMRLLGNLSAKSGRRARDIAPSPDDAWAVDLLAAAYAAGLDTASALRAVSAVAEGPAAQSFASAAAHVGLGQDVAGAWGPENGTSAVIPRVREALGRSADSGGSVTDSLRRAATWSRSRAVAKRQAAAERAGVLIAAPLGACFLPAFVCLGVAPVVVGLARQILPEVFG